VANSSQLNVVFRVAELADLELPRYHRFLRDESTSDEKQVAHIWETNGTSATTYYIDHLTSVTDLIIENLDTTNFVTLTFRTGANGATDNKIKLLKTDIIILQDVTVANNLIFTANTAAVKLKISYRGT